MLKHIITIATISVAFFPGNVSALGCVGRGPGQFLDNTGFEAPGEFNDWSYGNAFIGSSLAYPVRSGNNAIVANASYIKAASGEPVIKTAYVQQFVSPARTGNNYQIKAYYRVLSLTKGASCPDTTLPLTPCKLRISYVDQTIGTVSLKQGSSYVEFNAPFTPESSARYFSFNLECRPTSTTATSGCADVTLLIDDVTWTDPGHVCWTPLGCYTDKTSARVLPAHGRLFNWPYTTTIEGCQQACGKQGYSFAGLEFGQECFCGNEIGSGGVSRPAGECNMPCSGDSRQLCGGRDRLDIYRKP